MMAPFSNTLTAIAPITSAVSAHYANMGLDGVSCHLYNGIKGTTEGHMMAQQGDGTWIDHDDKSNHGTITTVKSQADHDRLENKTKIGIVYAPDDVDITNVGIPYIEMEPTDEDFYGKEQSVYTPSLTDPSSCPCIIQFCRRGDLYIVPGANHYS